MHWRFIESREITKDEEIDDFGNAEVVDLLDSATRSEVSALYDAKEPPQADSAAQSLLLCSS